jgi:hypothetical protein
MFGSARFLTRLTIVSAVAAAIRIVAAFAMRRHQALLLTDEYGYVHPRSCSRVTASSIRACGLPIARRSRRRSIRRSSAIVLAIPKRARSRGTFGFRLFNVCIGVALVFAIGLLARQLAR